MKDETQIPSVSSPLICSGCVELGRYIESLRSQLEDALHVIDIHQKERLQMVQRERQLSKACAEKLQQFSNDQTY